jgi:hypothetical protein
VPKQEARSQKPGASRNTDPDPLGLLPSSLRPDATKERDERARLEAEGLPPIEMHMDDLDKQIDQKWSENEEDYLRASNPMLDCVNRFKKDWGARANGMSFKFFTPVIAGEIGTEDYQKCLDPDGKPYMVGNDWMGMIPTRIAERRLQRARELSEAEVKESAGRFGEGLEKLKAEAAKHGMSLTTKGEITFERGI